MIVVAIVDVVIVAMVIAALRADFHDNLCVSLRGNRTNRKKHTQTENLFLNSERWSEGNKLLGVYNFRECAS